MLQNRIWKMKAFIPILDIMGRNFEVGIISGLLILLAAVSCSDKDEIKAPGVASADSAAAVVLRPDQQTRGANFSLYDGSVKTTDVKADYIEKYTKQDSTMAWGLDVVFFNSEGEQTSKLIADSGLIRESINWMVANGNVVVINEDGSRLETQQLFWFGNEEKIRSDSFVTIYQYGDTLQGYGLETDRELKRVRIKRQVTGTLKDTEKIEE